MTTMTTGFAFLGALFGVGLWLVIASQRMAPSLRLLPRWRPTEQQAIRGTTAAGTGTLAGVLTGWFVGAVLIAAAVWSLPKLLRRDSAQPARIEAIATWTEMLRDTLSAAAGIEQAILATAPIAPEAVHKEVTALARRLESGTTLTSSLHHFADDLADPIADLVVSSLLLASTQQARQLGELLGSLATTARDQAAMRMRIETSRSRTRTTVHVIVGTTLGFAGMLTLTNREYLTAYDTTAGQFVLLTTGVLFACAFAWLTRIAAIPEPVRVLTRLGNKDLMAPDNKDITP